MIGDAKPDIAILDLGLPDLDGLDVIRGVRGTGSKMPIIVLSSRAGERGKVEALDLGADDYVTKPFGIAELVARIRTALRHSFQVQGSEPVFNSGDLSVDLVRRIVTVKGEEVKLSPKEYGILRLLVLHAGKVLTHRFLMQEVWGPSCDVQYLRIYVRQLRQKIEAGRGSARAHPHRNRRGLPAACAERRAEARLSGSSASHATSPPGLRMRIGANMSGGRRLHERAPLPSSCPSPSGRRDVCIAARSGPQRPLSRPHPLADTDTRAASSPRRA